MLTLTTYALAALAEIAGCFAVWAWLRLDKSPLWLLPGLASLRAQGTEGSAFVGDPAYYTRFGFRPIAGLTLDGVPPENVLALPFTETVPQGAMTFHEAFMAEA